jgi:hypothetical protein
MTPEQYIARLLELVRAGQDVRALEFAAQWDSEMLPCLNTDEIALVAGVMESAELAASMSMAADAEPSGSSSGHPAA